MQHEKTGQLDLRERRTVILDSVILRLIRIEDARDKILFYLTPLDFKIIKGED